MRPRVDYERHGRTYTRHRRPDPRIAARVHRAHLSQVDNQLALSMVIQASKPCPASYAKGEPGQTMEVSHGAAPARFRDVQVGVA